MGFRHGYKLRRKNPDLSDQQKAFCIAYCKHFDKAQAYWDAGFTAKDRAKAYQGAKNLFKKYKVVEYIDAILWERRNSTLKIDTDALIKELLLIALSRLPELVNTGTGELKEGLSDDSDVWASVSELNVDEIEKEGFYRRKKKIKLADKQRAIDALLRISGLSSDLNTALRTLESYGIILKQTEDGTWEILK